MQLISKTGEIGINVAAYTVDVMITVMFVYLCDSALIQFTSKDIYYHSFSTSIKFSNYLSISTRKLQ